ncbi:hypothetical protein A8C56_09550 [Niabella ginsenosidivorans]|uniref:Uncharacterized protein n=1 Tax=Niabella ginsenosidivorans TaxID=1176587 RepID=A0A1A9I1I2_9BACT|nr:hypothetical protein [Niabella ginsenosidivorans]ANH81195.1 hypothetical protein A8C56_09550 [Niabella ginsenosidivorans]
MPESRIDLKKLRLQIALKYGVELDETALTILVVLLLEMKGQFVVMNKTQGEIVMEVQQSKKALQVDPNHPRWQAFWHGMGQWGLGLCLAVIAATLVYFTSLNNDKKQLETQQALIWYKEHYEAAQKVIDKSGIGTIEKKPGKRIK